ncbi:MAG: sigma-70 family RNA polymerase sigma factor [Saprospiraceae bacterium]|nr:sigma-70 family RNA polymerase sigma factor [Saprospiraceae bacterium]MDP4999272.1 sigma-70 family RNA polymerase sigma factor [Saprospiraceae bacterium]
MNLEILVEGCKRGTPQAQQTLYDRYSSVLFAICRRYLPQYEDAEDALVAAFFKIFTQIHQFNEMGSFEGWMKRIVVNECLMTLRRQSLPFSAIEIQLEVPAGEISAEAHLEAGDVLRLLEQLPPGYRTIFNLYVVEGYKHKEIADLLGVSINTSKSQLILAKKRMKELLLELQYPDSENYHAK